MKGGESPHGAEWRLAGLALGLLAGVALQLHQRALSAPLFYAALGVLGLGCLSLAGLGIARRFARRLPWLIGGAVLLAFASTGTRALWQLNDALPAALEGEDIQVRGVVASLPQQNASGVRFRFDVEAASVQGLSLIHI